MLKTTRVVQSNSDVTVGEALRSVGLMVEARLHLQPSIKAGNSACGNRLRWLST